MRFGLDVAQLTKSRRQLCRPCLDWSERRPHLGGAIAAGERALRTALAP